MIFAPEMTVILRMTKRRESYAENQSLKVSATDNHGLEGRERIYKMADIGGGLP